MMIFKVLEETLRTLRVTTYHPVGWSLGKLHSRLRGQSYLAEKIQEERLAPLLLIHGIFHNASAFYSIENSLKKNGFHNISTVELWTSLRSLSSMAEQLKIRVKVLNDLHKRKVRVVAHSLGGMVLRQALLDPNFASMIDKIIFMGVPHQGNRFYQLPYPRCLQDLATQSPNMKLIKQVPLPGGVHYWNLRGSLDLVTPSRDTFLPNVPNLQFDRVGHAGLLTASQVRQAILAILETPIYDESLQEANA